MKRKLESLPLPDHIKSHVKSTKYVQNKDVIGVSEITLSSHFDLSFQDVKLLVQGASEMITPSRRFVTCWDLFTNRKKQHLVSGLELLDVALLGGIPSDGITEVSSLSGVGKTNFLFTLALQSLTQYENSTVIFLDTNNSFNPKRIGEMALSRFGQDKNKATQIMSSIFRLEVPDSKKLHHILMEMEEIITSKIVKLVLLDSLGTLIEKEFGSHQNIQRNDVLASEAQKMKLIAESFSIPIVVTNHLIKTRDVAIPMLGNTWAHCVNTRLVLEKSEDLQWIRIAKSPVSENLMIPFMISECGVVDQKLDENNELDAIEPEMDLDLGIDLSKIDEDFDQ